jgi:hypothetical protein
MHPYSALEAKYFWATAVGQRNLFEIADLWNPKFRIGRRSGVATFGSCFAQHIGRSLRERGFNWLITEPLPHGLNRESAKSFSYNVFSARTGNIYTASLLKQWVEWALDARPVPQEVWEKSGRFYDPFRPRIEPDGFASEAEMLTSRAVAIEAFREALLQADILVFTLGLTESWFNREHDYEYPMCPGTLAGDFDAGQHEFVNQDFPFIRKTLVEALRVVKARNPKIRILLTVSPVPLTATMSGNHVLLATIESKSVLRAVAGALQRQLGFVDYFPSYEIINSPPFRGVFFESNQRSVSQAGVDHVMNCFFDCLRRKFSGEELSSEPKVPHEPKKPGARRQPPLQGQRRQKALKSTADVVCEEELLNAFQK